jgi:hypothetical protein
MGNGQVLKSLKLLEVVQPGPEATPLMALETYKAHRRPLNRLADRFGIGRIVLAPLDVSLHAVRRHQTHLVPQRRNLATPVMGCGTSLDPDQTRAKLLKKSHKLTPSQTPANNHLAYCTNTVNLENTLRDIQTYRANVHLGWLPSWRLKQPP